MRTGAGKPSASRSRGPAYHGSPASGNRERKHRLYSPRYYRRADDCVDTTRRVLLPLRGEDESAFYTLDHEGYVTRWNDRVEDVLGYSIEASLGTHLGAHLSGDPAGKQRAEELTEAAEAETEVTANLKFQRDDGVRSQPQRPSSPVTRRQGLFAGSVSCSHRPTHQRHPRSGQSASLTPRDDDPDFLIRAEPHMPPSLSVESGSVSVSIRGVRRAGRPLESVLECRR